MWNVFFIESSIFSLIIQNMNFYNWHPTIFHFLRISCVHCVRGAAGAHHLTGLHKWSSLATTLSHHLLYTPLSSHATPDRPHPPLPSTAPPPPPVFCPSVSNLHSPPLALLTPPRLSIRRLLRVLIPQRRHPPNNPVVRLARFHAHACPSSVYHAYDAGIAEIGGRERQRERLPLTLAHGVRRPRDTKWE